MLPERNRWTSRVVLGLGMGRYESQGGLSLDGPEPPMLRSPPLSLQHHILKSCSREMDKGNKERLALTLGWTMPDLRLDHAHSKLDTGQRETFITTCAHAFPSGIAWSGHKGG